MSSWYIFCSSMVNKCCSLLILIDMCINVGAYIDYIRSAVGHICAMWQAYLLEAYASNIKCMHTSAFVTLLIALSSYEVYTVT